MLCPACGQETSGKENLCQHCGQNIWEALEAKVSGSVQVSADRPSGRQTLPLSPASLAKVLLLGLGAGLLAFWLASKLVMVLFGGDWPTPAAFFRLQLAAILTWFTPILSGIAAAAVTAWLNKAPLERILGLTALIFPIGFVVQWVVVARLALLGDGPSKVEAIPLVIIGVALGFLGSRNQR